MNAVARLPYAWGAHGDELTRSYPCDALLSAPDAVLFRAVDVQTPASHAFRWLCQLRVAPYSYDWIDNGGRRSPRELTPGLEQLAVGQPFMRIFELVEFETGRHLTLRMDRPSAIALFGSIAVTYLVEPRTPRASRLLVKLAVRYPRRLPASLLRYLLPWGDAVMMRKQLLTLKRYAEAGER